MANQVGVAVVKSVHGELAMSDTAMDEVVMNVWLALPRAVEVD